MTEILDTWLQMMCCMTAADALAAGFLAGIILLIIGASIWCALVIVRRIVRRCTRDVNNAA